MTVNHCYRVIAGLIDCSTRGPEYVILFFLHAILHFGLVHDTHENVIIHALGCSFTTPQRDRCESYGHEKQPGHQLHRRETSLGVGFWVHFEVQQAGQNERDGCRPCSTDDLCAYNTNGTAGREHWRNGKTRVYLPMKYTGDLFQVLIDQHHVYSVGGCQIYSDHGL